MRRQEDHAALVTALHRLRPMAGRWTSAVADADDLLQDTAERALQNIGQYRSGTNATAWVRAIMYHLAVDHSRRCARSRMAAAQYREEAQCTETPDEEATPELENDASLADVEQASEQLDEPLKSTFQLWALGRLPYLEISRRQGIPIGTVATRLFRARQQVKEIVAARQANPANDFPH